jgi:diguanylate cyclase (GGDEF)-like protein
MTRPWQSLQFRLLSLCIIGGLLPALLVSAYFAQEQRHEVAREELTHIQVLAGLLADGERRFLQNAELLLSVLTQINVLKQSTLHGSDCGQILHQVLVAKPEYINVGIIDQNGEVLCSALPWTKPMSMNDRLYFIKALQHQTFALGEYQIGRISGRPSLNIGYPIQLDQGKGVIYVALDLEHFLRNLAHEMAVPKQVAMIVTDREHRILATFPSQAERLGAIFKPNLTLHHQTENGSAIYERREADGRSVLYVTRPIMTAHTVNMPVFLYLRAPKAVVYAPFQALLWQQIVILFLLTITLLLGLAWAIEVLVLRGVRQLVRATRSLATGDYSVRTNLKAEQGEIGLLGQTFDEMEDALLTQLQETRRQREQMIRQNRIHAMLSGINTTIVRVRDQDVLLAEACRIAVEQGRFPLVWIGLLDAAGQTFDKIWSAAYKDTPELVPASGSKLAALAPVYGQVVAQGRIMLSNDLANDAQACSWPAQALELGFNAGAILPLLKGRHTVALMTLYAQEESGFDKAELLLLKEVAEDITFALHYIEQINQLDYLVFHEPVTGLSTERVFQDRLSQRLAQLHQQAGMAAVLLIAFERLPQIVVSQGRYVRDALLCEAARRLQNHLPARDSIASTAQGELLVMLDDPQDEQDVTTAVHGILDLMRRPIRIEDQDYVLSCRIGISLAPVDGEDAERLIRHAASVLELLRREGKETYRFFKPEIQARIHHSLQLERAMRQALDREEFSIVYQPIVNLRSGRLVAMEALLRWQSRELGCLSPSQFIPLAEETGLIEPLGLWVLSCVCRQLVNWREQGLNLAQTSINVSARQLHHPGFARQVIAILERSQLNPEDIQIGLEITETALLEDLERTITTVNALRDANIRIYLDDFGTGYSSLSYLKQLPVDRIKADLSFVRDLPSSPASAAVISAIVAMAHSLGLKVIAEGVETESQRSKLIELCCDYAQGYYFAKPMPAEAMRSWLQE